jgi:hypothetical protein
LFTPTAAVFVEVGKRRTLRDSKLAADATAYYQRESTALERSLRLQATHVAHARRWQPQVNGRKNNNKSKLLGRTKFTRRPGT